MPAIYAIIQPLPIPVETKMFKIIKYIIYLAILALVILLYWLAPKYSYVKKNPGYCVNLTKNLYYCGSEADLKSMFSQ